MRTIRDKMGALARAPKETIEGARREAQSLLRRDVTRHHEARRELRVVLAALASIGQEHLQRVTIVSHSGIGQKEDYLDAFLVYEHLIDRKLIEEMLVMNSFVLAHYIRIGLEVLAQQADLGSVRNALLREFGVE